MRLSRSVWKTIGSCGSGAAPGKALAGTLGEQRRAGKVLEVARVVQTTVETLCERDCARGDEQRDDEGEDRIALRDWAIPHSAAGVAGSTTWVFSPWAARSVRRPWRCSESCVALELLAGGSFVQFLLDVRDRSVDASDALPLAGDPQRPGERVGDSGRALRIVRRSR